MFADRQLLRSRFEAHFAQLAATILVVESQMPAMKRVQRRAMPDRNHARPWQSLMNEPIQSSLRLLVERCGGLIKQEVVGRVKNSPRQGQTLLFSDR